jgi:hypothetical protein
MVVCTAVYHNGSNRRRGMWSQTAVCMKREIRKIWLRNWNRCRRSRPRILIHAIPSSWKTYESSPKQVPSNPLVLGSAHVGQPLPAVQAEQSSARLDFCWVRELMERGSAQTGLQSEQIIHRFPPPDDFHRLAINQHFRRPRSRIVVGREHHAVSSGIENRQKVSFVNHR